MMRQPSMLFVPVSSRFVKWQDLEKQFAASDSFVAVKGARTFMEHDLAQMKQVVDALPMHAQYLFDDKPAQELPTGY